MENKSSKCIRKLSIHEFVLGVMLFTGNSLTLVEGKYNRLNPDAEIRIAFLWKAVAGTSLYMSNLFIWNHSDEHYSGNLAARHIVEIPNDKTDADSYHQQ